MVYTMEALIIVSGIRYSISKGTIVLVGNTMVGSINDTPIVSRFAASIM